MTEEPNKFTESLFDWIDTGNEVDKEFEKRYGKAYREAVRKLKSEKEENENLQVSAD